MGLVEDRGAGFELRGVGCQVWGAGCGVWGVVVFGVWVLGVWGLGFRVGKPRALASNGNHALMGCGGMAGTAMIVARERRFQSPEKKGITPDARSRPIYHRESRHSLARSRTHPIFRPAPSQSGGNTISHMAILI